MCECVHEVVTGQTFSAGGVKIKRQIQSSSSSGEPERETVSIVRPR